MFIVKYYVAGAIAALLLAVFTANIYFSIVFIWISLSLSCVSLAYIFDMPKVFRKRDSGKIPLGIKWLFMPFFFGVQAYNSWARYRDSVPAIQKISPNLYLACRLFPSDITFLKKQGVSAILDATAEFDGLNWSADDEHLAYLNVPVLDHRSPHLEDVQKAMSWMRHYINQDKGVVVHCAMGRGRSVLIVAAYLLATGQAETVDDALRRINDTRATARLNKSQSKALTKMYKSGALKQKDKMLLVVNPVAGGGSWKTHQAQIEQMLSTKYELHIKTSTPDVTAKQLTQENKDEHYKVIAACGGDGTVNEVASVLVDTDICMAIIPLGTTNALSHVLLGIQSKFTPVETACEIILNNEFSKIDTAVCNDEAMVLVAGLGFEQRMIDLADRDKKNESGELAYVQALATAIKQNNVHSYKVSINGEKPELLEASSLVIANAAPFTTILAQGGETPDPSDGKLDLTILDTRESILVPLVSLGIQKLTQSWLEDNGLKAVRHEKIHEVNIQSSDGEKTLDYVLDGETRKSDRVHIKVKPSSLCVMHAA